jgi:hypothetical protein
MSGGETDSSMGNSTLASCCVLCTALQPVHAVLSLEKLCHMAQDPGTCTGASCSAAGFQCNSTARSASLQDSASLAPAPHHLILSCLISSRPARQVNGCQLPDRPEQAAAAGACCAPALHHIRTLVTNCAAGAAAAAAAGRGHDQHQRVHRLRHQWQRALARWVELGSTGMVWLHLQ